MGKVRKSILGLLLVVAMTVGLMPGIAPQKAQASAVSTHGQLKVKGGHIVDKKGKVFVIKGVSTHGLAWFPQYVNKSSFASLKKMGVNTVRLAMYTEEYNGYCTGNVANRTALKKKIDTGVKLAKQLGMYVIIDWHILSDGNPLKHLSEAKKFMKEVASKYKNEKHVLFEICNEPNGGEGTWTNIRKYAKSVIKTIRSVNKKAIIIVGTPTWSQDVDQAAAKPLSGSNIVYAFHFYAATHTQYMRDKLEGALKKKLPVLVTEFGLSEASGNGNISTSEGNKWFTLLDKYKVGRVCWNLSNKNETCALLKPSCKKTGNFKTSDLTKQGRWLVKKYK